MIIVLLGLQHFDDMNAFNDVEFLFSIRALRVDILPIFQIGGGERKGLIRDGV